MREALREAPLRQSTVTAPSFGTPSACAADLTVSPMVVEEDRDFDTLEVTFSAFDQSDPENAKVRGILRKPRGRQAEGLVIVLPILGGDYEASDFLATAIAEAGFASLRFDRKAKIFDPDKDFEHVASMIRLGVIDTRRGLDCALDRSWNGTGGVGILGISMGSFVGTLLYATEPRFESSVLALGGGDIAKIIWSARSEEEVAALFEAYERRGYSHEQIAKEAEAAFESVEPLRYASGIGGRGALLVHARFDAVVPYRFGRRLWEAAGYPTRVTLLSGHYSTVFYLPYLERLIVDHFRKTLTP